MSLGISKDVVILNISGWKGFFLMGINYLFEMFKKFGYLVADKVFRSAKG